MKLFDLSDRKNFVIRPVHDIGFKALMGHKLDPDNLLIKDFLKALFNKDFEIIEFKDRELTPVQVFGKKIRLDLRLYCQGVYVNLEMQMIPTGNESERALYYACASMCDQQLDGKGYDMMESVHQVFLMAENSSVFTYPFEKYQLYDSQHKKVLTDKMEISMISLERIVARIKDVHAMSDLEKWCLFFCCGHDKDHAGVRVLLEEERFRKADLIMRSVNEDEELKDAAFQRMKDHLDMITRMKNGMKKATEEGLARGLEQGLQQGMQQGLEQGLQQGLEQGLEQGIDLEKANIAKNMKKENIDIELVVCQRLPTTTSLFTTRR